MHEIVKRLEILGSRSNDNVVDERSEKAERNDGKQTGGGRTDG